jgi:hypothetical protein
MKAIKIKEVNVARIATKCINSDIEFNTSVIKGLLIETLKGRMMNGEIVRFCYQKLDGSIRYAVGTLQSDSVKANINGTGIPKRYCGMFAYLDLQKMAWRGFKEEMIIGIID